VTCRNGPQLSTRHDDDVGNTVMLCVCVCVCVCYTGAERASDPRW